MSCVPSVEPVSSTSQRSMYGLNERSVAAMPPASSLTIMHRPSSGRISEVIQEVSPGPRCAVNRWGDLLLERDAGLGAVGRDRDAVVDADVLVVGRDERRLGVVVVPSGARPAT